MIDSLHPGALWPALVLALVGLIALVGGTLAVGDSRGQYLVIGAPWQGRAQMVDMVWRAEGGVVGFGMLPSLAIAMTSRPDFPAAMRAEGAWLVIPSPVLLGCTIDAEGISR